MNGWMHKCKFENSCCGKSDVCVDGKKDEWIILVRDSFFWKSDGWMNG